MIISRKTTFCKLFLTVVLAASALISLAPAAQANHRHQHHHTRKEYIAMYRHIAIAHQAKYGIPASITMAQGILESSDGNSILARGSNNHFGIKCKSYWTGRTFTHTDDEPDECFRAYDTVEESYADHAEFLDSSPRYDSLFSFSPTDYQSWARALKNAGYATSPTYTQTLVKIIEDNELYLLDIEGVKLTEALGGAKASQQNSAERAYMGHGTVDPDDYRTTIRAHAGYNVHMTNGSYYILAKMGDSYESLSKLFGLTTSTLLRFNDIQDKDATLEPYDVVYLERKNSEWNGTTFYHTVEHGESLHDIAQSYGIRISVLRRLNKLSKESIVSDGMTINLR